MSVNEARQANIKTVRTKINRSQTALRHNRSEVRRRRDATYDAARTRKISGIRTDQNEKYHRTQKAVSNTSVWQTNMDTPADPIDSGLEAKKKKQKEFAQRSHENHADKSTGRTSGHNAQKQTGQGSQGISGTAQSSSSGREMTETVAKEGTKNGAKEAAGGATTGGVSTAIDFAKRTLRKTREELEAPIMQTDEDNGAAGRPDITKSTDSKRSGIVITVMSIVATMVQMMMPVIIAILIPTIIVAVFVGILTSVLTPVVQMAEAVESIVTNQDELFAELDDETEKTVLDEAFKYEGKPYLFGGSDPNTGVDCSGFTKWCYEKAGISLPHSAQGQYDMTQHISLDDAKPGDMVFFKETYKTNNFITHVEIYVGDGKSFGAGDPIGYHNLSSKWYQEHFVCCGRIGG